MNDVNDTWIFAYGSLIFRPGVPYRERRHARARGYARRFYQGSPDHRGTPDYLGRVVTLAAEADAACEGLAYRIAESDVESVLEALDLRERGGYTRTRVELELLGSEPVASITAVTWIAGPDNPHWLGPEPPEMILARMRRAVGPSGANVDYVRSLFAALCELGITDGHVEELARALEADEPDEP